MWKIAVATVLAFGAGGTLGSMVLWERDTYRGQYTYDGIHYLDVRVYSAWLEHRYYVHLPGARTHSWWLIDPEKRMIYLPNAPRSRLGLWWKPPGEVSGIAIDFDVKIGTWQWSYSEKEIRFANEVLDCVVERR